MSQRQLLPIPGAKHIQTFEQSSGVVLVRLNRAPLNAFNEEHWQELGRTFNHLSGLASVRAIVLSSSFDRAFTAGLDLSDAGALERKESVDVGRKAYWLHDHILEFQESISSIEKCHKPVIAAVHGVCLGLGVDITCACDIRLASSQSKFGIVEINVGLAADIGSLQRFPKIVSSGSIARELAFTGRQFDSYEAEKIGFISRVVQGGRVEVEREALEMATVIASKSPVAVVGTKRIMNYSRDHSVREGLEYTAAWNMAMVQSEDMPRSMKAFMQKKGPAKYDDLAVAPSHKVSAKL